MLNDIAICQAVLNALPEATLIKDDSLTLVFVNQKACEFFGYSREEMVGQDFTFFMTAEQSARHTSRVLKVLKSGEQLESEEVITDGANKSRTVLIRKSRITLNNRFYVLSILSDISLLRSSEAQIRYLAYHDTLTGLPNRTSLNEELNQLAARSLYHPQHCALLVFNLNFFTVLNDTYGYQSGDTILCEFGQRLRSLIGQQGMPARLGADEFALLLRGKSAIEEVEPVASAIIAMMHEPFTLTQAKPVVTLSCGIVSLNSENLTAGEILRRGNAALREAQRQGQNTFCFYSEALDAGSENKRVMVKALAESLTKEGELTCVYQPILRSSDEKIIGVEALARWTHPELGPVPPVQFISLAEETGLVSQLGESVLRQACRHIRPLGDLRLAINVSAVQLRERQFAEKTLALLHEEGFPCHRLELELTETAVMNADADSLQQLMQLRTAGIKISLDDFGTGYSSLSLLKDIAVDSVKIDRSFVQYVNDVTDTAAIVTAVSQLGHKMKLNVIAEGVENDLQKNFLLSAGCSHMQGFLFSRPVPVDVLTALLPAA
ncbi:phosphodiesterase [Chimaeribacter californicus]|uniref:Phosphodiesterase n=1 Tax=Chimaeribacter californicus TaxID=2060067 RepID=A0A2N5EGD2_9GAMM|nr:GGDEF domain-containing phosphodiesterase [Chimaeribacter californicus]PLR41614.1 phosphodiesterase [Chimaeribacter californicus]